MRVKLNVPLDRGRGVEDGVGRCRAVQLGISIKLVMMNLVS